nr:MAG TPA: hypothetical protein [Caudoviricetes sp.]
MLYLIVYLFDFYERFRVSLFATLVIAGLVLVLSAINLGCMTQYSLYMGNDPYYVARKIEYNRFKKAFKTAFITAIVAGVTIVVTPSKQGITMLGATYVGTQVYDSLNKSALVDKAMKILDKELNSYLDQHIEKDKDNDTRRLQRQDN